METSYTPLSTDQDAQAELSEVDLGNPFQDFDELIIFSHTFLNYRQCECCSSKKELEDLQFGVLLSNEFLFGENVFDSDSTLSTLSDIQVIRERIQSFDKNDQSKISFLEDFADDAAKLGFGNTTEVLLPLLLTIPSQRNLAVTEQLLKVFPKIVDVFLTFGDNGYNILRDHILKLLLDAMKKIKNEESIDICINDFIYIAKNIKEKEEIVITAAVELATEGTEDYFNVMSVKIFGQLCGLIEKELCECYLVPHCIFFADNKSQNVKKTLITNFPNFCKAVNENVLKQKLIPTYKKLSSDKNWTLRKTAAQNLPKIADLCDNSIISSELIPIYQNFANDQKEYVKQTALEVFGEFINYLDKEKSKDFGGLLDFYISTIKNIPPHKAKKDDIELLAKCAYNFPAVLSFYGKESWERLRECYDKLSNQKELKIKSSIASSLGVVADLVGSDSTEIYIVPNAMKFFKTPELQLKVLNALPLVIKTIKSERKNMFLEYIKVLISKAKWRIRVEYAKTIGKFHDVYTESITYKRVFPIAMNFCFDDVYQVRIRSARSNSKMILQLLKGEEEYRVKTLKIIESFARSVNFAYRQLFIFMTKEMFKNDNEKIFNDFVGELLLDLAYDSISNVRVTLGMFISKMIRKEKGKWVKGNEIVRKIVKVLKKDKFEEVKELVKDLKLENVNVEIRKDVNGKFVDKMEFVSKEFGITKNVPLKVVIGSTETNKK